MRSAYERGIIRENKTGTGTKAPATEKRGMMRKICEKDKPALTFLQVGQTQLQLQHDVLEYEVSIPVGHPPVPRITAATDDGDVSVRQAMFAPGEPQTYASVTVRKDGAERLYRIHMKKDPALGFVLQYDDRCRFSIPDGEHEGGPLEFRSTNPAVLAVEDEGVVHAVGRSREPVCIHAVKDGSIRHTWTVDRVERAQINVFLIVGQSNAYGAYDQNTPTGVAESERPCPGTSYCLDVTDLNITEGVYDLSKGRRGFSPALGKRWYELTGEKTVMIQTAVCGSPIERWEKNEPQYGGQSFYERTVRARQYLADTYGGTDSNWEVLRTGAFWCQGETGEAHLWKDGHWNWNSPVVMSADTYYRKFLGIAADMKEDLGVDFWSIMLVRTLAKKSTPESLRLGLLTDLVPVRAAQYAIHNTTDPSISIMSRLCDVARMESSDDKTSPGYAFTGNENLHYTQKGYNAQGNELAENTYAALSPTVDRTPRRIEVLDSDGRTKLQDGAVLKIGKGCIKQIAAIMLPLYTDRPGLQYQIAKGADICRIDLFGRISFDENAREGDTAELLIQSSCGLERRFCVVLTTQDTPAIPDTNVPEPDAQDYHHLFQVEM